MTKSKTRVGSDVIGEVARKCLLTRTRKISRVVTNLYDRALRPHGINSTQVSLLATIAKLGGASRAEIGRANYQESSTLTRNLALLLKEGWVQELPPEGRSRPIILSEAGRSLLAEVMPAWRAAQREARELIGDEGVAALVGVADSLPLSTLAD